MTAPSTRKPLPLEGPVADRVRELMAAGNGRPSILSTLKSEGHDVTDSQVRTLYEHLRSAMREDREHVREAAAAKAMETLVPQVGDDLGVLQSARDLMRRAMRRAYRAGEYGTAARCAAQAISAARARLDLLGVKPEAPGPLVSEADAARILQEEFGDTGAMPPPSNGTLPQPD